MASKEVPHPKSSHSPSSDSSGSTPESFDLETRYIVLSFLSQNPHERHPGCIYSSTASSANSDSNPSHLNFLPKKGHQSFPTSPRKSVKKHKLGKLDSSFRASEDNVSYKYSEEYKKIQRKDYTSTSNDSSDGPYFQKPQKSVSADRVDGKGHFKSLSLDHGLNQGRYFFSSESSPVTDEHMVSASTPFLNYRQTRQESELSSDTGNLSYTSDADDEYESTSSSLHNSFMESRGSRTNDYSLHRLTTLLSESEQDTDLSTVTEDTSVVQVSDRSGFVSDQNTDNVFDDSSPHQGPEINIERNMLVQSSGADLHSSEHGIAESSSVSLDVTSSSSTTVRPIADRSKLRLIIRDQQEWEAEHQSQIQQVLATVEEEINTQMVFLESEVEEAIRRNQITRQDSPFIAPLSPHTEAAMTLMRIGDEMKDFYGDRLNMIVAGLCTEERPVISYEEFRCVACSVIDQILPGWRQVAFLLVYGQSVVWRVAEFGYREFGELANNTARLISELFSDFITSQGGWGAVVNYDSSRSSSVSPPHSSLDDNRVNQPSSLHHSPGRSPSPTKDEDNTGDPLSKWQQHHLSSNQPTGTSADQKDSDHVTTVQNKPSGDHVTYIPPPDELACHSFYDEDYHCEGRQTVSLGDIQMTFDPSCERINHQDISKDEPCKSCTPEDSDSVFKNNIPENNHGKKCDVCHKCSSYSKKPSSKPMNASEPRSCCHGIGADCETQCSCYHSNMSNNNISQQEAMLSMENGEDSSMLDSSPYGEIPPLDLSGWASDEGSDTDPSPDYVRPEPPDQPDFFSQFFSIDTFLSLSICAISIMAAIAITRK